jgi:nicotinamidase-related amidase
MAALGGKMANENRSERAILILDMINDIAHPEGRNFNRATVDIVPFLQGELQYFRERARPVVFCNTKVLSPIPEDEADDFCLKVIQALSPRTGEITLRKTRPNAFFATDLEKVLKSLKVKTLTIVGAFSHTSILMSASSALDYGFSVVVPETCVCASDSQDHAAAMRIINRWTGGK